MNFLRLLLLLILAFSLFFLWKGFQRPRVSPLILNSNPTVTKSEVPPIRLYDPNLKLPSIQKEKNNQVHTSSTLPTETDENQFKRRYPEDSTKSLSQLEAMYALPDLQETLKLGTPRSENFPGTYEENVFRLIEGGQVSYRRFLNHDEVGRLGPDSCVSLRFPGKEPLVAKHGDGTLKLLRLPQPYTYIEDIENQYFTLTLIEYSRWRQEIHERDPSSFLLYAKQRDGRVKLIGEFLRPGIDGQTNSGGESPMDFCRSIPEPAN